MAHNNRDFNEWLSQFKSTIASYDYYVDFDKVAPMPRSIKPSFT